MPTHVPGTTDERKPGSRSRPRTMHRAIVGAAASRSLPLTVADAEGELRAAIRFVVAARWRLRNVYRRLKRPADLADREEHRLPYDRATEIVSAIECTQADHLRPAVESLRRAVRITDEELAAEFEVEKRWRRELGLAGGT